MKEITGSCMWWHLIGVEKSEPVFFLFNLFEEEVASIISRKKSIFSKERNKAFYLFFFFSVLFYFCLSTEWNDFVFIYSHSQSFST